MAYDCTDGVDAIHGNTGDTGEGVALGAKISSESGRAATDQVCRENRKQYVDTIRNFLLYFFFMKTGPSRSTRARVQQWTS